MGVWKLGSKPYDDGSRDVILAVNATGAGPVTGTLTFKQVEYTANGDWAASGSVPGRNYSAFYVGGSDNQSAPEFIVAAGTMKGSGADPDSISINIVRTDSTDGLQYGWDGELLPM
ncbi:MAG: hypothetical protein AAFX04_01175 [Pseudomonadota bacterium]